jgi:Ca2+-binding EF-hand superfamily protein
LTYDQNLDDEVTWKEFCNYFKLIEPDHQFAFDVLNSAFNAFDINGNGKIKLEEFVDLSEMEIKYKPGHKQIHLGFTENEN